MSEGPTWDARKGADHPGHGLGWRRDLSDGGQAWVPLHQFLLHRRPPAHREVPLDVCAAEARRVQSFIESIFIHSVVIFIRDIHKVDVISAGQEVRSLTWVNLSKKEQRQGARSSCADAWPIKSGGTLDSPES